MAVNLVVNGVAYPYPNTADELWGDNATNWAIAVTSGMLQKAGGAFTLTSEVDFGNSHGIKALYFKSRGTVPATTGAVRLAVSDVIAWRNNANTLDLPLAVDGSDNLTFNGTIIGTFATVWPVANGGTGKSSWTTGAIAYRASGGGPALAELLPVAQDTVVYANSLLIPTYGKVTNAMIDTAADIAPSKIKAASSNRLIASSGTGGILAVLAAISANHVLYADSNGLPVGEQFLAKSRGGAGADMTSVTFPSSGVLVTTAAVQALTNKDYDGGTASNTSRLTVPSAVLATLQGLTRKEATLMYATDVDRLYVDNGTTITPVGAGSGSINYCTNPDAEASTSDWATYANAAATAPTTGTGGSPNITLTRTTTTPLAGLGSFLITKDAANRQGQGVSTPFTIDTADQGKQIVVSFAAQTDTSYVANDILVYVVDVTNSLVYQLAPAGIPKADGSGGAIFTGIFQASSNSTSYRLCFHIATTNASAYTVEYDRVSIAPTPVAWAPAIGDWQAYTPTVTGLGTGSGTASGYWRRVGDSVELAVGFTKDASAGTGASTVVFSLPPGITVDTSKRPSTATTEAGYMVSNNVSTSANWDIVGAYYNGGGPGISFVLANGAGGGSATGSSFRANSITSFRAMLPVSGWGSNIQIGSYDGRTVAMRANTSSTGAFTAATTIVYSNEITDTHAAYDPSTGIWTCPVAGAYDISGSIFTNSAAWTAGNTLSLAIAVNGTAIATGYTFPPTASQGLAAAVRLGSVQLNVGDTVRLQGASSVSVTCSGGIQGNFFSISLVPGRSTLSAGDTVAFAAYKNSGSHTSTGNPQTIASWNAASFDTTGSFNATTGVFTAPIAGIYDVTYAVAFAANSTGTRWCKLQKNGVDTGNLSSGAGYALLAATAINTGGAKIRLIAGDTLQLQGFQNSGGNLNYATGSDGQTFFAVSRIGS